MVHLSDKIIHKSRKEAICGVCNVVMPKGTPQRVTKWIDEDACCYCVMRICLFCDGLDYVDRINDAWSSEDGAPLDSGGFIRSAVRFDSDAMQNYLLD